MRQHVSPMDCRTPCAALTRLRITPTTAGRADPSPSQKVAIDRAKSAAPHLTASLTGAQGDLRRLHHAASQPAPPARTTPQPHPQCPHA